MTYPQRVSAKAKARTEDLAGRFRVHVGFQELRDETLGSIRHLITVQYQTLQEGNARGAVVVGCGRSQSVCELIRRGRIMDVLKDAYPFAGLCGNINEAGLLAGTDLVTGRQHVVGKTDLPGRQENH